MVFVVTTRLCNLLSGEYFTSNVGTAFIVIDTGSVNSIGRLALAVPGMSTVQLPKMDMGPLDASGSFPDIACACFVAAVSAPGLGVNW